MRCSLVLFLSSLLLSPLFSPPLYQRQRFLVDQGYSFKVITELKDMSNISDLKFGTKKEQLEMLAKVLATEDAAGEEEIQEDDPFASHQKAKNKKLAASRRRGNAQALSGSNDRASVTNKLNRSSSHTNMAAVRVGGRLMKRSPGTVPTRHILPHSNLLLMLCSGLGIVCGCGCGAGITSMRSDARRRRPRRRVDIHYSKRAHSTRRKTQKTNKYAHNRHSSHCLIAHLINEAI